MATAVINGVFVGAIYALFTFGIVLVHRGSRVLNFAHGETGLIGAFVFVSLWGGGLPLVVAMVVAVALSAAVAGLTYALVIRHLEPAGPSRMVATIGVAALLLTVASRRYGTRPQGVEPLVTGSAFSAAGITVSMTQLLVLGTMLALAAGWFLVDRYTDMGLRLRAIALEPVGASELGLPVQRIAFGVWALAGALAALAGVLISSLVVFHVFFMTSITMRALVAALIGGLSRPAAAMLVAVGLGVLESIVQYEISAPGATEATLAVVLVAVVLLRPGRLALADL